jgi:hypothetical protein
MTGLIDTKTKQPWPAVWRNRRFEDIRAGVRNDMKARDRERGIPDNGQVYLSPVEDEGGHRKPPVVDRAMADRKHTMKESKLLYHKRRLEFCQTPHSLDEYIEKFETPDASILKAAQDAAKGIEDSLPKNKGKAEAPKTEEKPAGKPKSTKGGD